MEKLNQLSVDLGFSRYTDVDKGNNVNMLFITSALMFGTAGLPHVIVRFFTIPWVRDARISAGWALLFIAILYTTAPSVAVFARTNLINDLSGTQYDEVPQWFHKWENTGLLTFEDKNGDGKIQYLADEGTNELTIDRDIIVLANPEIADLPEWVIALVVAGGLAAASFFPAIIMGIFDKRMNREGAISGMIVGILFTMSYIVYFKPQLGGPGTTEGYWF